MAAAQRMRGLVVLASLAVLLVGVQSQATLPFGFVDHDVAEGFAIPTDICFLPGSGSKFIVVEKQGMIKLVENGQVKNQPVFDMTDRVHSYLDRGAVSCAVDVDYNSGSKYVYIGHAYENNADDLKGRKTAQVTRFEMNGANTQMVPGSDTVILGKVTGAGCNNIDPTEDVLCCDSYTHCIGDISMDNNGHLFISMGDGAFPQDPDAVLSMRPQSIQSLNGGVLRVTRDGKGVVGNPWFSPGLTEDDNESKQWAIGMRNSFRLSPDSVLGAQWTAEVGWSKYEEINLIEPGKNYGWPCMHGDETIAAYSNYDGCVNLPEEGTLQLPTYFYARKVGTAVSGAIRLNFGSWPAKYSNLVFFSDYVASWVYTMEVDGSGNMVGNSGNFAEGLNGPVRLLDGPDDCLYYVSINAQTVRKICYEPDTSKPEIVSQLPPNNGANVETTAELIIQFSKQLDESSLNGNIKLFQVTDTGDVNAGGSISYNAATYVVTFTPNSALAENAVYRVEIGSVTDPEGRAMAADVIATFMTGTGSTRFVSDESFVSTVNAIGPVERDSMNGGSAANDGDSPILIRTNAYEKGLGVCGESHVVIDVPAGCTRFQSAFGIADELTNYDLGGVYGKVLLDGTEVFTTASVIPEPLSRSSPEVEVDVDITGALQITLSVVDGNEQKKSSQKSAWGGARFRCGAFDATPPTVTEVSPVDGETDVAMDLNMVQLHFSEAMDQTSLLAAVRLRVGDDEIGWSPQFSNGLKTLKLNVEALAYGTEYTVSVSKTARDLSGNKLDQAFESTFTTVSAPSTGSVVYLSDLTPTWSNSKFDDGTSPVVLLTRGPLYPYAKGIGGKPGARVDYTAPAGCTGLEGILGVDASTEGLGRCRMQIKRDSDKLTLFAKTVKGNQTPKTLSIAVTEGTRYRIQTLASGGQTGSDVCNWADLRFTCSGGDVYVSDLTPDFTKGDLGYDTNADGGEILVGVMPDGPLTASYDKGLILQQGGKATYNIPGSCSQFHAQVGAEQSAGLDAQFKLLVKTGNNGSCQTHKIQIDDMPYTMSCPIDGDAELRIQARDTDGNSEDDVIGVADAKMDCAAGTRNPTCVFNSITDNFRVGDTISFSVTPYNFLGQEMDASAVTLRVKQFHCAPCHEHNIYSVDGKLSDSFVVDDHGDTYYYQVLCDVCDGNDCTTSSANSYPETTEVTVVSDPAGLQVGVDSAEGVAPLTTTVVVGADVQLSTFETQLPYTFNEWAHDPSAPAQTKVKVSTTSPVTYTVTFQQ